MRNAVVLSAVLSLALAACVGGDIQGGAGGGDGSGDGNGDGFGDGFGDGSGGDVGDGSGDDGSGGDGESPLCDETVPVEVTQTQKSPDVLLVLDKSGSMGEDLGFSGTKMDVMKDALSVVLPARDAEIKFGFMFYPADNVCGPGDLTVPVGAGNASDVLDSVLALEPEGATPTHTSLDAARSYYASTPENLDGRFVLLATDGLPNCNGNPDFPSNFETLAAAERLREAGIPVYVIGFGDVVAADPGFLSALAQAGGTGDFFPANSPAELEGALQQISGTVVQASCDFALGSVPANPDKLAVTIDGVSIARDPSHQSGWDYDAASNSIVFYGETCEAIKSGSAGAVGVDYGCGGPVIG